MANADDDLTYDESYGAPGPDPTKAPPGFGEYIEQSFLSFVDGNNLTFSGVDLARIYSDSVRARPDNRLNLSREEAHKLLQEDGIDADLPVGPRYSSEYIDYLRRYQKRKREREELFSRNESTLNYMAGVPTYLASMVTDPITVASAFIPIVGEARYASALKAAGTSWTQRALVRAQMGAYEGAVGSAIIEPLTIAQRNMLQDEYSFSDSLGSLMLGTVFGSAAHGVGGAAFDLLTTPKRRIFERNLSDQRKAVLAADTLARMKEDLDPRVDTILDNDLKAAGYAGDEGALPALRGPMGDDLIAEARGIVAFVREASGAPGQRTDLLSVIKSLGGLKLVKENGEAVQDAGNVLEIIKDGKETRIDVDGKTKRDYGFRGLVDNKYGKTPAQIAEILSEQGWLKGQGEWTTQDFLDLLEARARAESVDDFPVPLKDEAEFLSKREKMERDNYKEEMREAGVINADSPERAAAKLAAHRAKKMMDEASGLGDERAYEEMFGKPAGEEAVAPRADDPGNVEARDYDPDYLDFETSAQADIEADKWIDDMVAEVEEELKLMEEAGLVDEADKIYLRNADALSKDIDTAASAWRAAAACMIGQ